MGESSAGSEEVKLHAKWLGGAAAFLTGGLLASCAVELGNEPFSCVENELCPSGYACVSGLCVVEGEVPADVRAMRVTWINSAEMYWFASAKTNGATLVVNDGFTPSLRGLYEIEVDSSGVVSKPKAILDFAEDYPTSSAVVALNESSYGVLSLRFPAVDESAETLRFTQVAREGSDVSTEILLEETVPFVGGTEPPYVSALARKGGADLCFSDASDGGRLSLIHLEGSSVIRRLVLPLPSSVLPLSGDCFLWEGEDELFVRVGLDVPLLYRIADSAMAAEDVDPPLTVDGLVVHADPERLLSVVVNEGGEAEIVQFDWSGTNLGAHGIGWTQETLEPHTAVPSVGALLLGPRSSTDDFDSLDVLDLTDPSSPSKLASVDRRGVDNLYSGRSFRSNGRVYIAWTALREDLMDLWIASTESQ